MYLNKCICKYLPKINHSLLNYLDDKCQFWLDDSTKVLTSPFFGHLQQYYHNLNCTWILEAEQGSYVNFEIDYFRVNYRKNDLYDFSK